MTRISLGGLDPGDVLAVLYNAAAPVDIGFRDYDPAPLTGAEARELLLSRTEFNYLRGRTLKLFMTGSVIDVSNYDRDNGPGAAAQAITLLIRTGDPNHAEIRAIHRAAVLRAAADAGVRMQGEDHAGMQPLPGLEPFDHYTIGLDDHRAPLIRQYIERAIAAIT